MDFNRRTYLAALGAGLLGHGVAAGTATASSNVRVSGAIESAAGVSLDGSQIEFFSPEAHHHERATVEDGRFEALLEANTSYEITFWYEDVTGEYRTAFDGVPILYGLEEGVRIGEDDTDLGTYEVPAGSKVQLRFENTDGNPVQGLPVTFRAVTTGAGTGPGQFTTNSDGYVYADSETDPGVELTGDVAVEVRPPGDHDAGFQADRLTITEDREVTIPIRDPESYGGTVAGSETDGTNSSESDSDSESDGTSDAETSESTTDARTETAAESGDAAGSSESHRGFLTNDPESSFAFLDDPVALTWGGIAVSIGGIMLQLFGRQ